MRKFKLYHIYNFVANKLQHDKRGNKNFVSFNIIAIIRPNQQNSKPFKMKHIFVFDAIFNLDWIFI